MFYHKHKSFDRYIYLRALYNKNLLFKNYDLCSAVMRKYN